MNAKAAFPCAVLMVVVGWCGVRGQDPSAPMPMPGTSPTGAPSTAMPAPGPMGQVLPPPGLEAPGGLSSWITYHRPDCCGPFGGDGPLKALWKLGA